MVCVVHNSELRLGVVVVVIVVVVELPQRVGIATQQEKEKSKALHAGHSNTRMVVEEDGWRGEVVL